jgi:hypothetical protein
LTSHNKEANVMNMNRITRRNCCPSLIATDELVSAL